MFTATPLVTNRRSSTGRRKTAEPKLPYIPVQGSFSYGSTVSNSPKPPPRLEETTLPLAAQLQARADAAEARIRAQEDRGMRRREADDEEEGGRVRRRTRKPVDDEEEVINVRSGNGRNLARYGLYGGVETTSNTTTTELSRSFASEEAVEPVLGYKISQTIGDNSSTSGESDNFSENEAFDANMRLRGGNPASKRGASEVPPAEGRVGEEPTFNLAVADDTENEIEIPLPLERNNALRERSQNLSERALAPANPAEGPTKSNPAPRPTSRKPAPSPRGVEPQSTPKSNHTPTTSTSTRSSTSSRFGYSTPRNNKRRSPTVRTARKSTAPSPWQFWDWFFYHWHEWLGRTTRLFFQFLLGAFIVSNIIFTAYRQGWFRVPEASTFTPPLARPETFNELAERLQNVEREVGERGVAADRYRVIKNEVNMLNDAMAHASTMSSSEAKNSASTIAALSAQVSALSNMVDKLRSESKGKAAEAIRQGSKVDGLFAAHRGYGKELHEVKKNLELRNKAFEAFKEALPKEMAARVSPDGNVELEPAFRRTIEDIFVHLLQKYGNGVEKIDKNALSEVPSWSSFLAENEQNLRTIVNEELDQHSPKDSSRGGIVLSRQTVLNIISQELENSHQRYHHDTVIPLYNALRTSFSADIRAAVTSASYEIVSAAAATASTVAQSAAKSIAISLPRSSFPAAKEIWQTMPDYAAHSSGGSIWPHVTSPSYDWTSKSRASYWMNRIFGRGQRVRPPPVIAISPTVEAGDCWPFAGNTGDIGIKLSDAIHISHLSIEHVSKDLAHDITTAPRHVSLWAQIPDPASLKAVQEAVARSRMGMEKWNTTVGGEFVKLLEAEYDINDGRTVQTWEVPIDLTAMGISSRVVAVKIGDNWGNEEFTCLYRVRVHGYPVKRVEAGYGHHVVGEGK
ncbi:hypothetical protein RUND412_003007 [Rhizina undulata]